MRNEAERRAAARVRKAEAAPPPLRCAFEDETCDGTVWWRPYVSWAACDKHAMEVDL